MFPHHFGLYNMKFLIITVLLTVNVIHCYVISDDNSESTFTTSAPSREKDPEDMNQILESVSKTVFGDDTGLMKEIAEEIDEEMSDSSKEVLEGMKRTFLASLLRLREGGELYKDARREAMLSALFSALKETSEGVDPSFVSDLMRKLELKEQRKRQKAKEFESNGLKTQTGDQSLQDK